MYDNITGKSDTFEMQQQSSNCSEELLGIEVTLLVAAAAGKGINVSIWIAAPDDGIMSFSTFCSKLISLSRVVGVDEGWETKRELDLATSKPELLVILRICNAGVDAQGNPMINTKKFLTLCKERVNGYLLQMSKVKSPPHLLEDDSRATDDNITSTITRALNASKIEETKRQRPQSAPSTRKSYQDNTSDSEAVSKDFNVIMPSSTTRFAIPQRKQIISTSKSQSDDFLLIEVSMDELNKLQEELQQKLCILVSKSNLYHIILAQLGFIQEREYSKSPLATAALAKRAKRLWLTISDILMIFSSVQFQLQRYHITILIGLIEKFKQGTIQSEIIKKNKEMERENEKETGKVKVKARGELKCRNKGEKAKVVTGTIKNYIGNKDKDNLEDNNEPVTKTSHLLSATWLQRYLVYLRIQGKKSLIKQRNKTKEVQGGTGGATGGGVSTTKRMVSEVALFEQLKRALAGLPYILTENNINMLLQNYQILSEENIHKEIDLRSKLWKIDADGRGDYQHQLRVQTLREIKETFDPTSELVKATVYGNFKDSEIQQFRKKAKESLLKQMKKKLWESEQSDSEVTKSLFWKFVKDKRKEKGKKFGDWLNEYFEDTEDKLSKIQNNRKSQQAEAMADIKRAKELTPLTHIVNKIEKIADNLTNSDIKMELRKSLSVLKKEESERLMEVYDKPCTASDSGAGTGSSNLRKSCKCSIKSKCPHDNLLVSKDKFDKMFVNVLASSVNELPKDVECVKEIINEHRNRYKSKDKDDKTDAATVSSEAASTPPADVSAVTSSTNGVHKLPSEKRMFLSSKELALQRAKEVRKAKRDKNKVEFAKWKSDKKKLMEKEREKKLQKEKEIEEKKKSKQDKANEIYRTWRRLRDQHLYLSKSGELKPVMHTSTTATNSSKRRPAWRGGLEVEAIDL